jgi:hypothetical protein
MRHTRTQRRQDTQHSTPTRRPHLQLVGPDFHPAEPTRRAREKEQPTPLPHQFFCTACECEITRFDADTYHVTGRCGPCDDVLG